MNIRLTLLIMALSACGPEATPGRRVAVQMELATRVEGLGQTARDFVLPTGWALHLDEAYVVLGPIYLRAPKRVTPSALRSLLLPRAHAHGDHAQTLREAEVVGEYLGEVAYDALGGSLLLGPFESEARLSDSLSLVIGQPRTNEARALTRGSQAFVRGYASDGQHRVDFACGMNIMGDDDETPENLEARRRVDRVAISSAGPLDDDSRLRVYVHVQRWFEFVRFEELEASASPCPAADSAFILQWYLGMRRPDAYSAEIVGE